MTTQRGKKNGRSMHHRLKLEREQETEREEREEENQIFVSFPRP